MRAGGTSAGIAVRKAVPGEVAEDAVHARGAPRVERGLPEQLVRGGDVDRTGQLPRGRERVREEALGEVGQAHVDPAVHPLPVVRVVAAVGVLQGDRLLGEVGRAPAHGPLPAVARHVPRGKEPAQAITVAARQRVMIRSHAPPPVHEPRVAVRARDVAEDLVVRAVLRDDEDHVLHPPAQPLEDGGTRARV